MMEFCPHCGKRLEECEHSWRPAVVTLEATWLRCRECGVTRRFASDDERLRELLGSESAA